MGSASTNVWKAPLLRVFEHEDGGVPLKYVEVNKLLYFWVRYMRIYWLYKWEKQWKYTELLYCSRLHDFIETVYTENSQVSDSNRTFSVHKN
jgi:hypothetical protein